MAKPIIGHFTEFVGKRIANRRKAKKMSSEDLAKKIGVSATVLDHMEHGYCNINIEQLMLFVHYLAPVEELLGLPHYSDMDMFEFVNKKIQAMTEDDLRAWKQDTAPILADQRRIFILDSDPEE
jgi:transcriptional regulator with XRE-family HTH domain